MSDIKNNVNSISIKQGNKFKYYQDKIKKKEIQEGFESLTENSKKIIQENDYKNSQQILENLRKEYKESLEKYNKLENEISNINQDYINRTSKNNPYLNKLIRFNTGHICYVTNQGVVKYIPSPEIWDSLGISYDYIQLDIPYLDIYNNQGTQISTTPPLISGTPVVKNQSLGNEGLNIFVSDFIGSTNKNSYVGCYEDNDSSIKTTNSYSWDECMTKSIYDGFQYFGLQNIDSSNKGKCVLSNNLNDISIKEGRILEQKALWSSNTFNSEAKFFKLTSDGRLLLLDNNNNIIWSINSDDNSCWWSGGINPDSLSATYGANCNNITIGNVNTKITDELKKQNYPSQLNIPINNSFFGDPAVNCPKDFDTAYQCGNAWKSTHITKSEGQYFTYDCKNEVNSCNFYLLLQDSGNLIFGKGADPYSNNNKILWQSNTLNNNGNKHPTMNNANSKFKRNYIKNNEILAINEYIISNDERTILLMQSDGNLVLYSYSDNINCKKLNNGKMVGGLGSNAIYDLGKKTYPSNIGKLGYIDENSILNLYNNNEIYSNTYSEIKGLDAYGEDIPNLAFSGASLEKCKEVCNNNNECSGFVLSSDNNYCWPKTNNMWPYGSIYNINNNRNTYIRSKVPSKLPEGVMKNTNNIDTIKYENYIKGNKLEEKYGLSTLNSVKKQELEQLKDKINLLANELNNYTSKFGSGVLDSNQQLDKNVSGLDNYIKDLKITNNSIVKVKENINNGLSNIVNESEIIVLQKNYNYMFWSIIATATLLITMNIVRK
jgi:hypothetical protein